MKSKQQICLILHNIRSAYNVGSIFRTVDAAGVEKIYLCGITPAPTRFDLESLKRSNLGKDKNDKISKTALGAEKFVPWEQLKQTWRLLEKLKSEGAKIIALEQTKDSKNIFKCKFPEKKIALIVGNEVKGLSREILKYCDDAVQIPMFGKKESLNVAVATGVALYQITLNNGLRFLKRSYV